MKRIISLLLALSFIVSLSVISYAEDTESKVLGGISLFERAGRKADLLPTEGEARPDGMIFAVDADLNVTAENGEYLGYTLREAMFILGGEVRPIIAVSDEDEVRSVCTFFKYSEVTDFFIMSDSAEILALCRAEYPIAGTVLDLRAAESVPEGDELRELSTGATSVGINVFLFSEANVTAEVIRYFYTRMIYSWVEADPDPTLGDAIRLILTGAFSVITSDTDIFTEALFHIPENIMTRVPVNIGHRGSVRNAPENTLEGVLLAIEQGADAVEVDVQLTADGNLVLMHELTTGLTCNADLTVAESTLDQLKELTADRGWEETEYAGVRIPTLREIYDAIDDDTVMLIEIKDETPDSVRTLCEMTAEYGFEHRVIFISFFYDQLLLARELLPQVPCSFLTTDAPLDADSLISSFRPDNITVDYSCNSSLDAALVCELHSRAFGMIVWTVKKQQDLGIYNSSGYLWITTDIPHIYSGWNVKVEGSLEGQIIPGKLCAVQGDLMTYTGTVTKAKAVKLSSLGNESIDVKGRTVTFHKSGRFDLLVCASLKAGKKNYAVCDIISVPTPSLTVADAINIVRYASGYEIPCDTARWDVDGDGTVNVVDAVEIVRGITGHN